MNDNYKNRTHFEELLQESGIFEALRFINAISAHRFTALYAFDGPTLKNICLVDKENAAISQTHSIRAADSYCFYVRESGRQFIVPDSLLDERVLGHAKREVIRSYCGFPLATKSHLLGTICHFDFPAIGATADEIDLLDLVAPALVRWLDNYLSNEQQPGLEPGL